jgi:hypothetical protein
MGDFYEMFFEDAETASRVLGITLTSRSKGDKNQVPMCGVPYHAISGYLSKMVKAGYRVALCEQTEDPKEAKGLVKREVVRVVSPGVTTDDQLLDEKSNTFVCTLTAARKGQKLLTVGLSFLDVSTGNFLISDADTGKSVTFGPDGSLSLAGIVTADALATTERAADPTDPAEGANIQWQSNGTGSGDDGDIMLKITAGGVTKTITLVDYSAF